VNASKTKSKEHIDPKCLNQKIPQLLN